MALRKSYLRSRANIDGLCRPMFIVERDAIGAFLNATWSGQADVPAVVESRLRRSWQGRKLKHVNGR